LNLGGHLFPFSDDVQCDLIAWVIIFQNIGEALVVAGALFVHTIYIVEGLQAALFASGFCHDLGHIAAITVLEPKLSCFFYGNLVGFYAKKRNHWAKRKVNRPAEFVEFDRPIFIPIPLKILGKKFGLKGNALGAGLPSLSSGLSPCFHLLCKALQPIGKALCPAFNAGAASLGSNAIYQQKD